MEVKGQVAARFTFKGRLFYICHTCTLNFLHSIWYLLSPDCMDLEFYPVTVKNHGRLFEFESVSETKRIIKRVKFDILNKASQFYNLALTDVVKAGVTSDIVVSDNADMPKVMATVIHCLLQFLENHPSATVLVRGNSPARNRLYRAVINREISNVKNFLEIYGTDGTDAEPFRTNTHYEAFFIKLRL